MIQRPKLWNRSLARSMMMGKEPTFNPSPAAQSILGARVSKPELYNQGQARRKLRPRTRTLNPVPAAVATLASLLKLPGFLKKPSERRAADVAPGLVAAAIAGNLTAAKTIRDRSTFGIAAERAVWANALAQLPADLRATVEKHWQQIPGVNHKGPETAAADALARPFALPGAAVPVGVNPAILQAGAGVAGVLGKQLIQSATKTSRARSTRVRQVTRYDPSNGDKYKVPSNSAEATQWPSRKPTKAQLAGLGGGAAAAAPLAGKAAGLAGAGAGAIAGVVIGGLAVGLLIGTGLRKLFGTAKAVRAEEAAVQGALVLRNTRTQLEAQLGRKLNAAETRALFDEYAAQLVNLGFVQNAQGMWHRPRSFTERLLG